jgi:hypothetical protein
MSMPRKDSTGRAVTWDPAEAIPKIVQFSTYPDLETGHVALLEQNKFLCGIVAADSAGRQQMRNEKGWLAIQLSSAKREIIGHLPLAKNSSGAQETTSAGRNNDGLATDRLVRPHTMIPYV